MEGTAEKDLHVYLQPTYYIESDLPEIVDYAREAVKGTKTDLEKGIKLYYAVRDDIPYDPYRADSTRTGLRAGVTLRRKVGHCVSKGTLLAAVARAVGIPSRVGFADVRNHISTEGLLRLLRSETVHYHGYMEMFLENRWVKATPAFDAFICGHFNVHPLEFDGRKDSLFQEFDCDGKKFMEYITDHGTFPDLPYDHLEKQFHKHYPHLAAKDCLLDIQGNFQKEALTEKQRAVKN